MAETSHIIGGGYGSSHIWKREPQQQFPYYIDYSLKFTEYTCRICNVKFFHRYDVEGNIFKAIEDNKIPEKCLL